MRAVYNWATGNYQDGNGGIIAFDDIKQQYGIEDKRGISQSKTGGHGKQQEQAWENKIEESSKNYGYTIGERVANSDFWLDLIFFEGAFEKTLNQIQATVSDLPISPSGIAGLLYGAENIPESWINLLARRMDIEVLASRLSERLCNG